MYLRLPGTLHRCHPAPAHLTPEFLEAIQDVVRNEKNVIFS